MKKKLQQDKCVKINIETVNINNNKEEKKDKTLKRKSKSTNKKVEIVKNMENILQEIKQTEISISKKPTLFNLEFIFRRERYILKNLYSNFLISKIKKLISKKISVDLNLIHIYYLDKEITNDKLNVYDLIKNNTIKFFEVKKESPTNENIISLNSKAYLAYKVRCKNIEDIKDFIDKIELFFRDKCLNKYYLCEPVDINIYDVCFCCEDTCYQFKRYMSIIRRLDQDYKNTTYEYVPFDKNNIFVPKLKNYTAFNKKYESSFINKGPYITYEDIQKRNEKEEKKKWISKKGFVYK